MLALMTVKTLLVGMVRRTQGSQPVCSRHPNVAVKIPFQHRLPFKFGWASLSLWSRGTAEKRECLQCKWERTCAPQNLCFTHSGSTVLLSSTTHVETKSLFHTLLFHIITLHDWLSVAPKSPLPAKLSAVNLLQLLNIEDLKIVPSL